MLIDSHVHIGKTEKTERFFSFDSYLELMKEYSVDKAIVMPNVSSDIRSYFYPVNYNIEDSKQYLDKHSKELNGLIKEMDKNERRKKKRRKIKNESSSEQIMD